MSPTHQSPLVTRGQRIDASTMKPNRRELIEAWRAFRGNPPTKGLSTRLLAMAVAYDIQVKQHGGLNPRLCKRLAAWACDDDVAATLLSCPETTSTVRPGSRLVREWQGKSHVVDVHDRHFIYEGKPYRSLSAVARTITGARWSGPRFFGLSGT